MLLRSALGLFTLLLSIMAHAEPNGPEEFLKIYQTGLQVEKEKAAESLAWAGLSSPKLFDLVEKEALAHYATAKENIPVNYVSWQVRALGFSGNEKYRATLEKILDGAPAPKVKKYTKMALRDLGNYARYNEIIAPKGWPEHQHPTLNQRLINMMKSDDPIMKRMGAKRIHYSHMYKNELLSILDEEIKSQYQNKLSGDHLDAMAWMCKALAGSRVIEYKPTIEMVYKGSKEKRLRKYAKKYLRYYGS